MTLLIHPSTLWTDAERETLRRVLATGGTVKAAAEALGRPVSSVQTHASRMGLTTWDRILASTREGIRHFGDEGWTSSRIARRFKVPVQFVDHLLGRAPA